MKDMQTEPAPRYSEVFNRLAPKQRILVDDGYLEPGKGLVPGVTRGDMVKLEDDGLKAGRGLVPG